jgi:hypothetical protein
MVATSSPGTLSHVGAGRYGAPEVPAALPNFTASGGIGWLVCCGFFAYEDAPDDDAKLQEFVKAQGLLEKLDHSVLLRHCVIGWRIGTAQDDHGRERIAFGGPETLEDIRAGSPWEVQVQKHQVKGKRFGILVQPSYEVDGLLSVLHDCESAIEPSLAQRHAHQQHIRGIILDEDNLEKRIRSAAQCSILKLTLCCDLGCGIPRSI